MPRVARLINPGDRFGLWTVHETAGAKMFPSGQYQKQFLCQCDCGTKGLVTYSALTRGKSMSCGCAIKRDHAGGSIGRYRILEKTAESSGKTAKLYRVRCDTCESERKLTFAQVKRGARKPCTCKLTRREFAILGGTVHGKYGTPEHTSWQGMIARCSNPKHPSYENYGGKGIKVAPEWRGVGGFQNFFEHVGPRPDGHSLDRINPFGNYEPGNVRWATKDLQESNKRPRMDPTEVTGVFHDRVNGGFYVKFDTKLEARFAYAMSRAKGPHPVQMQRSGHTPESAANILAEKAWLELCGVS